MGSDVSCPSLPSTTVWPVPEVGSPFRPRALVRCVGRQGHRTREWSRGCVHPPGARSLTGDRERDRRGCLGSAHLAGTPTPAQTAGIVRKKTAVGSPAGTPPWGLLQLLSLLPSSLILTPSKALFCVRSLGCFGGADTPGNASTVPSGAGSGLQPETKAASHV